jgi:hypothetical protein
MDEFSLNFPRGRRLDLQYNVISTAVDWEGKEHEAKRALSKGRRDSGGHDSVQRSWVRPMQNRSREYAGSSD